MKDLSASTKLEIYRLLGMISLMEVSVKRIEDAGVAVSIYRIDGETPTSLMSSVFTRGGKQVLLPPLDKHAKVEILKSIARAIDAACADDEKPEADMMPHQSRRKGHRL